MISSLQRRILRAKRYEGHKIPEDYVPYRDIESQKKEYLARWKAFKKETKETKKRVTIASSPKYDPHTFTLKYWNKLRRKPDFISTAPQIFWTSFEAFVEEFGLAPSRRHRLTRLPYLKQWTKDTTYWEM